MDTEQTAEQTEVEGTTEQESPTVEQNQSEEAEESTSKGDAQETPSERNWRALREENARLKAERDALKTPMEPTIPVSQRSDLSGLMSADDRIELRIKEARADAEFSDILEADPIFKRAVEGEYIDALSRYNQALLEGRRAALPDPYKITKKLKGDFDARFGQVSKKAEIEGAKKATEAKASKEATVEAEGRSDRSRKAASLEDLADLSLRSRRGDSNAIAERLSRSGL